MGPYVLRRLLIAVPVLLGITVISYLLINRMPGSPVLMLVNPDQMDLTSPAALAQQERLGLNDPLPLRYLKWLGQAVTGNLGYSFVTREPVLPLVLTRLASTAELVVPALLIAVVIALLLGIAAATHRGSWIDYLCSGVSVLSVSLPSFFLALGGIYVFSLKLGWLPTAGKQTLGSPATVGDFLLHLAMPALILALLTSADLARYVRSSLIDVLGAEFLRTARSKGLAPRRVLFRHALRNGLLPLVTALGTRIPELLGGAVIIETIFQWPGMGALTVQAIGNRDYPVLMGVLLVAAVVVLVVNLLTDVTYGLLDPRVRLGGSSV